MASFVIWIPLIVGIIFANSVTSTAGDFSSIEISKPQRPRVFATPDELRNYLEALGRYYTLAGRNRYGKRSPSSDSPSKTPLYNNYISDGE